MRHSAVQDKFLAFLDGRLSESEQTRIQEHLNHCTTCQLAFEEFKYTLQLSKAPQKLTHEVPPEFSSKVMKLLESCEPLSSKRFVMVKKISKSVLWIAIIGIIFAIMLFVTDRGRANDALSAVVLTVVVTIILAFLYGLLTRNSTLVRIPAFLAICTVGLVLSVSFLQENVCQLFSQVGSTLTTDGPYYPPPTHRQAAPSRAPVYSPPPQLSPSPGQITPAERVPFTQQFNTETYDRIYDNEFLEVAQNALSTFSIDVDTASYSNVRRFLNNQSLPPKDAVRIEELLNYFTYDYPQPEGEEPFAVITEISNAPWRSDHRLLHIGLQGRKVAKENVPPSNLVFLIDTSGSMQPQNKLPLLKRAFRLLVDELRPEDRISLVVYAGAAGVVLPSTPGSAKGMILEALERLRAGGSTAGGAGISLAYEIAKKNFIEDGNNRVILATDGDFNVGISSTSALVRFVEEKRDDGIFLTVLGFGMGNYKDSRMEQLADKGNGNYAYIDNIREANKVMVKEFTSTLFTIAKDVKIQIEFNPQKVKAYRLIGYENRLLKKEDFNDDTKDAGELGAGHTVTALYELIPAGSSEEVASVDPLKYQTRELSDTSVTSNELVTVKLRYKKPNGFFSKLISKAVIDQDIALEQASENFKFSAAVAEFGMLLRDSKFKANSSFEQALSLAKEAKGRDENGYRAEFIRLLETAKLLRR